MERYSPGYRDTFTKTEIFISPAAVARLFFVLRIRQILLRNDTDSSIRQIFKQKAVKHMMQETIILKIYS